MSVSEAFSKLESLVPGEWSFVGESLLWATGALALFMLAQAIVGLMICGSMICYRSFSKRARKARGCGVRIPVAGCQVSAR